MIILNTVVDLPQRILNKVKYLYSLPRNYSVEEVFLVSYPKSGNTWLRFLIANALKVYYEVDKEVNFFTIEDIIPSLRGRTPVYETGPFGRNDIPRLLKSHAEHNPYYRRVILLVRDPRDVMVSHYHYLLYLNQLSENITISEFMRSKDYGIQHWLQHSRSWYFNANPAAQLVRIFRYEDLLKDTEKQLWLIMDLLGINMTDNQIKQAIELSSKERMRASEKKHFPVHSLNPKMSFVREGAAKKGQDLSETDKKFIEDITKEMLHLLGYQFSRIS